MKTSYLTLLIFLFINPKVIITTDEKEVEPSPDRHLLLQTPLPIVDPSALPEQSGPIEKYIPVFPYDTLKKRIEAIGSEAPLHFNPIVEGFINYFTVRNRDYTQRVIARSKIYYPLLESYLQKHDLPDELKHLAIVESALVPSNVSPMGAAGLWQLMIPTAQQYGLTYNEYLDERMDPKKSTDVACQLLSWLHDSFGDWELALAAYNTGYGNVKKALRKSKKKTFWAVYDDLPRETRSFLPQFVALTYVMNYLEEHNFDTEANYPPAVENMVITGGLDLREFSQKTNYCYDDLKELNPHIRQNIIPESEAGVTFNIPFGLWSYVNLSYVSALKSTISTRPYAAPDQIPMALADAF